LFKNKRNSAKTTNTAIASDTCKHFHVIRSLKPSNTHNNLVLLCYFSVP
jgi:hypothetical protein